MITQPPPPELVPCLAGNRLCLILLPAKACNFRCVYCCEDFRHGRMEGPVSVAAGDWR